MLMCRSGDRSSRAANLLADLGYTRVYSVVGGFEGPPNEKTGMRDVAGWKKDRLPLSYELDKAKMYFVRWARRGHARAADNRSATLTGARRCPPARPRSARSSSPP